MIRMLNSEEFDKIPTGDCTITLGDGDALDGKFYKDEGGDVHIEVPDVEEMEGQHITVVLQDGGNSTYAGQIKDGSLIVR